MCDPVPEWIEGVCRWQDALYVRLRGALRGRTVPTRRRVPDSRLPCRVDALTLLVEIDKAVASWESGKGDTVDRLHRLASRGFRPQDCALIDGYCDALERWALQAVELLTESPKLPLPFPCPTCGTQWTYRRNSSGESVRQRVLRVSEHGCECLSCKAAWEPDQFHFLARLLGCEPLPV